jgi:hypothetical protein
MGGGIRSFGASNGLVLSRQEPIGLLYQKRDKKIVLETRSYKLNFFNFWS